MKKTITALVLGAALGAGGAYAARGQEQEFFYTETIRFDAAEIDVQRLAAVASEHGAERAEAYACRVVSNNKVRCKAVLKKRGHK